MKFSFFRKPISNVKPQKDITILDAYKYITSDIAKEQTLQLRSIDDKKTAKSYKARNFDYVTFGGSFDTRDDGHLLSPSNYLCLDFDHLPDVHDSKKRLLEDPIIETVLIFISPSGDGLKWIIPIRTDTYRYSEVFVAVTNYLKSKYNLIPDQSCKDISRACFLPYDPEAYINPKECPMAPSNDFYAKWLETEPNPVPSPMPSHIPIVIETDVEEVIRKIEAAKIDITYQYSDWVKLGFALCDGFGENGRSYFHRLSRFYPYYNSSECDCQYSKCLQSHGSGITISTFFQMAKDHGIDISRPSLTSLPSLPSSGIVNRDMPIISGPTTDGSDANDGNDAMNKITMPCFYPKVKGKLPVFLEKIAGINTSNSDADMLILGSMTVLSSCLPKLYGIYDRRTVYPNLYLFVTSRAGIGKGRLRFCKQLAQPVHNELKEIAQNSLGHKMLLILPANSSATAFYQALHENDGIGLLFETEGDTLSISFGQDFSNFSDGIRKAFQHETISYLRRKDNEYVDIPEPRLSIVLSGTNRQINNLVTSVENGLVSRFIFFYLGGEVRWNDVFAKGPSLNDFFEELGENFLEFYHKLSGAQSIKFEMTESQEKAFNSHFSRLQQDYVDLFGEDTVASVRRLALSTFRIALILSALRSMERSDIETPLICNDDDFQNAIEISQVLQQHMLRVLRELPSASKTDSSRTKEPLLMESFWKSLPKEFETREFHDIATSVGLSIPTAERYVRQWTKTRLDKIIRGKYKKRE